MKRVLAWILLALLARTCATLAQSPPYPIKPVRLVVPLVPGGGADTLGRYMARQLSDGLGQAVIVENRTGGGGLVGGEYVARAAPDGYTLLVGGTGQIVVTLTHRRLDIQKDFTPIAMVMAGQVSLLFSSPLGVLPFVKAGRVRGLAVSIARRMSGWPDIPTVAESGMPGFESVSFLGLHGPAGLPRDIVTRLNAEAVRIVQRKDVQDWLVQQGSESAPASPEQYARRIKSDVEKLAKVVREAKLVVE